MPEGVRKMTEEEPSRDQPTEPKRRSATVEDDVPAPSSSKARATPPSKAPEPAAEPMEVEPTEEDNQKRKAADLKAQGTAAYKSRSFDDAVEAFQAAWDAYPKDVTFLTNLAAVYFEQAEWKKCIEICEKAVDEGRSLRADYKVIAKAIARIGSAYEKEGNLEQAVKYYGKSLTEHRTPDVLAKLRAAEKVKADAEKQAYINPELAEKAREEGNVAFKSGQFADAVKHYTEAIKRLPSDPRGYNNRAAAYNKLAALPEALKDADEAIKIDPAFIKAYLRKATVLTGMKEHSKAMEALQAVSRSFRSNRLQ
jgi:stress-induced-phosphoprotein 1